MESIDMQYPLAGTVSNQSRRECLIAIALTAAAVISSTRASDALGLSFGELSQTDASAGVKAALERGADIAVQRLGRQDGFWANDWVRIPLPDWISKAERGLKLIGKGRDIEDLKLGVNRAAEQAVPQAKKLLTDAVSSMTVQDAKAILKGGGDSVTMFFKDKTARLLEAKFLPIVTRVTDRIGLAKQYNQIAAQIEQSGLIRFRPEQRRVETHVTVKTLDGLYFMIGEEERKIRRDPVAAGSDILRRVFGTLR